MMFSVEYVDDTGKVITFKEFNTYREAMDRANGMLWCLNRGGQFNDSFDREKLRRNGSIVFAASGAGSVTIFEYRG